jgi:hypothetical protein
MADALPGGLAQLVAEMTARGFFVTATDASESLGNRLIELAHDDGPRVRLVRDRGLWSAEVEVAGDFYNTYEVVQALDDAPYSTRALSHEERRRHTLDALSRLPHADTELAPIRQRLLAYRTEYNRRLGVEPA